MRTNAFFFLFFFVPATFISCKTARKVATPNMEIKTAHASSRTDNFLIDLLKQYPHHFDSLLKHNAKWQVQIIYTQVDRRENNEPVFTNYYFNVEPNKYFYPASTVKMPIAALALQKINELKIPGLNRNTTMVTEALSEDLTGVFNDPTSEDGRPTIEHYIKKIFLVSDNDAFNRLYEFLGQDYIHTSLNNMGYDSVQILHRLSIALNEEQNRTTNPIKFYDASGKIIYQQPVLKSNLIYQQRNTLLGKGFMRNGQLVNEPFD
ncbi:MAG: serine hydrolase, partial [Chitinophagaceae bacterium]